MIVRTSLLEWKQTKRSNLALQWSSLIFFQKRSLYLSNEKDFEKIPDEFIHVKTR